MKLKLGDEEYEFDPQALSTREATQLKVQADLNYSEITGLNVDDPRVLQAVIWLCRTREGEKRLLYGDIDVPVKDIAIVWDEPEPGAEPEAPIEATPPPTPAGSPNGASMLTENSPNEAATA